MSVITFPSAADRTVAPRRAPCWHDQPTPTDEQLDALDLELRALPPERQRAMRAFLDAFRHLSPDGRVRVWSACLAAPNGPGGVEEDVCK